MISEQEIFDAGILIVDDLKADLQLLEQILRKAGYRRITSTTDPYAVCALHRDNHYDLILLDLEMPGMDGFQVMKGLKEIETGGYLPALVITIHQDQKLHALQAGAKDFISKPFDLAEVLARVHNMLEVRLLYTKLENSNKVLESLALHDALTGLPNRRLLKDRLSLAIAHARRNKRTMAVIYLDMDGLKQINDTLGHDTGDTLLVMVAARLVAAVREEDMVARLGGDTFAIALWELSHADGAAHLVSKVIQVVSQPYSIQGRSVSTTVSVGVGIYPADGGEVETLMKSADLALLEAKRTGKDNHRTASAHRTIGERASLT